MALPSIDSFDALGGAIIDYSEVLDSTTDLPAAASNAARADVAGMSILSPRARVHFTNDGTDATLLLGLSVVGPVTPAITKAGTAYWQITFPATCVDFLGETQYWNFRWAKGETMSGNAPYSVRCVISSPTVVDVFLWDQTGAASELVGEPIGVDIY